MAQFLVTRGTTLHGKALDEGAVVELNSGDAATLHDFIQPYVQPVPEPVQSEPEEENEKPKKKK